MTTLKPSQLLADPAKWGKGHASNRLADTLCMMQAVEVLATSDDECNAHCETLRAYVGTPYLTTWNDAPERTHSEVIAALVACDL